MYIKVDKVKYDNIKFTGTNGKFIQYESAAIPELTTFSKIQLFGDDNNLLREDLKSNWHRFESKIGFLLLTNSPVIETKNAVYTANSPVVISGAKLAREYAGEMQLSDGQPSSRLDEKLEVINLEPPVYKKWAGDINGYRIPIESNGEWVEGCTDAEAWDAAHPYQASDTERIAAAEKAILALMNRGI